VIATYFSGCVIDKLGRRKMLILGNIVIIIGLLLILMDLNFNLGKLLSLLAIL